MALEAHGSKHPIALNNEQDMQQNTNIDKCIYASSPATSATQIFSTYHSSWDNIAYFPAKKNVNFITNMYIKKHMIESVEFSYKLAWEKKEEKKKHGIEFFK